MGKAAKLTSRQKASREWRRAFAQRYEDARRDAGATFEEIGHALGISKATANHWYTGVSEISASQLVELAGFLKVSPGWLLSGEGVARTEMHRLSMGDIAESFEADTVIVEIESSALRGLDIGDECIFDGNR